MVSAALPPSFKLGVDSARKKPRVDALPDKYYLGHFNEFITHIETHQYDLLSKDHIAWIKRFRDLHEPSQCLLVRMINRKGFLFRRDAFQYDEISDIERCFDDLTESLFLRPLKKVDFSDLIKSLTKNELIQLTNNTQNKPPTFSSTKAKWQSWCLGNLSYQDIEKTDTVNKRYRLLSGSTLLYFQFLFFGKTDSQLNLFSLRDMGIMKTKAHAATSGKRFESLECAECCFQYHLRLKNIPLLTVEELMVEGARINQEKNSFEHLSEEAMESYSRYIYELGLKLLPIDESLATLVLRQSNHPKAIEKTIRLAYANQEHDWVHSKTHDIIDNHHCESLILFAEDFYERKFHKKKLSKLTAFLRNGLPSIPLDEAFIGQVEKGIKQHHVRQGKQAFRTENRLWRGLFGLTFWSLLFKSDQAALCSEFDQISPTLKNNQFYRSAKKDIHKLLDQVHTPEKLTQHLTKIATVNYGRSNGIFRWHPKMLEILSIFIDKTPIDHIGKHLISMAKDFQGLKDGYPDLMVSDGQLLWFEEIKAPGDQLRRNQMITISRLQKNGFDVRLQPTHWDFNSEQPYVVVDVETTGGRSAQHRITEIAMIKIINNKVVDQFSTLINPQRRIPVGITQLTGISDDMVADASIFAEISESILSFMEDSIFVAHNVNFDYGFLQREFERIDQRFVFPKLCTVRLARKHLKGLDAYGLKPLCQALDIELKQHHRALADAQATCQLLIHLNRIRFSD